MKQLVVLSGKGGTGKTSVTAAFAHLAFESPVLVRAVLTDADVDAANLELVLRPQRQEEHEFVGGSLAVIDQELCNGCSICEDVCRFDAILENAGQYAVDPIACDGCASCVYQCPEDAICMEPQVVGEWYRSNSRYGPLLHAELKPAQENSGKLVTMVKQQARLWGRDGEFQAVLVDGPPGIGCPVISAASGADLVLIVAEPTASGIHDMERVLKTTEHFQLKSLVCINKADIYAEGSVQIEKACQARGIELVGLIPFDEAVTQAMVRGEPVTAYSPESAASVAIQAIWKIISSRLLEQEQV